ncbi:undecaprenyldiphospho-muramoylpentapeptide beta-N-acetylglucosaminyltransferase [Streptomyces calidiresistens]|uniref:UDP-N-acetylglucosamine--N-acetylmuramyl- (pentapeptide) pyrophosphoryl-undecaprenol N-acetylglucosamine transferase n=1 Tax=Streptomyces calidiresistens TaxID=1485586 RepID=UPI002B21F2B7|nr:UDP-N-acetylglucosamine--N-acetylmuramyl-(pentapeptide) pyrophosphoryl-undecaprenol N-acetylglucosamine transferase [Streptomyces calidiresistens]
MNPLDSRLSRLHRPFRLLVTGGGTGGHTYPALTVVREAGARLAAVGGSLETVWVGTPTGLEARVAQQEGIPFRTVATGRLRRSANPLKLASPTNIKDMGRVPLGVAQARAIIRETAPDVVLSTGGYVAVPVGLATRMARRPLVIHEQTVRLGLANRVLARVADRVAVSSEATLPLLPDAANARITGNPVRPELLTGNPDKARASLGLDPGRPTVYVTGGAQGAVQINRMVLELLPELLTKANVIHQCGTTSVEDARAAAGMLPAELAARYRPTAFVGPELPDVLALADVVIARSGAGTIAELTALGKPSLLVPLATSAGGEQAHNARHLQSRGAALALVGEDARTDRLRDELDALLNSEEQRRRMGDNAAAIGRPDAAARLTDLLFETDLG